MHSYSYSYSYSYSCSYSYSAPTTTSTSHLVGGVCRVAEAKAHAEGPRCSEGGRHHIHTAAAPGSEEETGESAAEGWLSRRVPAPRHALGGWAAEPLRAQWEA